MHVAIKNIHPSALPIPEEASDLQKNLGKIITRKA